MPSYLYITELSLIFLSTFLCSIAFIITFKQYIKYRYRHILYFSLVWIASIFSMFFIAVSVLINFAFLLLLSFYIFYVATLISVFAVDHVSKETLDPFKMFLMGILGTLLIITSLQPDATNSFFRWTISDPYGPSSGGLFRITFTMIGMFQGILLFIYFFRIFQKAPKKLKNYSKIMLIGGGFMSFIFFGVLVTGLTSIIPGLQFIILSIGIIMISVAFEKAPKLAFVLPFIAYKINVIHTKSGVSLFSYSWNLSDQIDDSLFSGMLQGISLLMNETVNKGILKEINLEKGVLLLQESTTKPFTSVLIVSRSSRSLRVALNKFTEKFSINALDTWFEVVDTEKFIFAKKLIDECFPFIPDYTN